MVDWEVTATTIYCDSVDDEVTLIVHKDFSVKCTGYIKYSESRKNKQSRRRLTSCTGLECPQIAHYKEKLLAEEAKSSNKK